MTHQYSAHGTVNSIRAITTTNICPLCKEEFKKTKQAKDHAQLARAAMASQTTTTPLLKQHEARTTQLETKDKKKTIIPRSTKKPLTICANSQSQHKQTRKQCTTTDYFRPVSQSSRGDKQSLIALSI